MAVHWNRKIEPIHEKKTKETNDINRLDRKNAVQKWIL